jgi:hypothetical protein
MTATEYRLCVSETPAQLAGDVTELLSQGWELYGHPFQTGNGNGSHGICQAMVKAAGRRGAAAANAKASRTEAKPETVARTRTAVTLRSLAVFLAVATGGSLLGDALVFRSGFYGQFLAPLASTGTMERMVFDESHRQPTGKREVLVIGNSRIAEGFGPQLANEYKPQDNYWFASCPVPGSPARTWYYFVRDVDPHRNRYAAIAIPLEDYDDTDSTFDPADGASELSLDVMRLRWTDLAPFTLSFKSWESRFTVLRGGLFKGLVLQRDLYDFFEDPGKRLEDAKAYREHGYGWGYAYGGNTSTLAGIAVDWTAHRATFPASVPEGMQQEFTRQIFAEPEQHGYLRDFQSRWLGALADLYRGSKTRIIVYQIPRNFAPRPTPLVHLPWTTVDDLHKRPWVSVVDRHVFEPLEKPELFFDYVHLNIEGRKLFTMLLADTVKQVLK